mmetsp:Transcript_37337/g.71570  ORF Transcript_37337/g.71570 Transcript_37337/m.71570 type:complete len:330 (-) Transcript_37337:278-1267(-)
MAVRQRCLEALLVKGDVASKLHHHLQHNQYRLSRVEQRLLVLLQIAVVCLGEALAQREQGHERAVHARRLAARQLHGVGVLLLRHDAAASGHRVAGDHELELFRRPQHPLLRDAAAVHGDDGQVTHVFQQKVPVRYRVQAVGHGLAEAEQLRREVTVRVQAGASKSARSERADVDPLARVLQALRIALKLLHVREEFVRQQDGLRALQVGVARHHQPGVGLGQVVQGDLHFPQARAHLVDGVARPQPHVRHHLVVARARRVQLLARLADLVNQRRLHVHVHVLTVGAPLELASFNLSLHLCDTGNDLVELFLGNQILCAKHCGMCPTSC